MSLVLATITGTWHGHDDSPAEGTVTFTPYGWRNIPATDTILVPRSETSQMAAGIVVQQLVAPTDPADDEVRYLVEVTVRNGGRPVTDAYDIVMPPVPAEGAVLDLADRQESGLMVIGSAPVPPVDPGTGTGSGDEGVWD